PDLTLTKSVTPSADLGLNDIVTYTITLSNSGNAAATGILITDTLPAGVTFDAFVENTGGAAEDAGVITWNGDLADGESLTIVFTALVADDTEDSITNVVEFVSENAGDGTDEATFTLKPQYMIYLPLTLRNHSTP
ncbi:MAG: DUF11 domain-containing protein, partial [Anaerolineales bacterium]